MLQDYTNSKDYANIISKEPIQAVITIYAIVLMVTIRQSYQLSFQYVKAFFLLSFFVIINLIFNDTLIILYFRKNDNKKINIAFSTKK